MAAGLLTLAGVLVAVGALVWLHLASTGLSPVRNAVSEYGISPARVGYRVLTLAMAGAGVGALLEVASAVSAGVVLTTLAAFTGARALISWFPMDPPGEPVTGTGRVHLLLAGVAFGGLTWAARDLPDALLAQHAWTGARPFLATWGAVVLVLVLLMLAAALVPGLRRWFGAAERLFYVGMLVWLAAVGVAGL